MKRVRLALLLTMTGCDAGSTADASMVAVNDAGSTANGDAGQGATTWQSLILQKHNEARAAAMPAPAPALPPMTWSDRATGVAQTWADRCKFEHNTGTGYGENLYASTADSNATEPVDTWASEAANYTYATNTCTTSKVCGHYTQVVWRSSIMLGCGKSACTSNSPFGGTGTWFFWVCDYSPPGNFVGQKPY